MLLQFVVEPTVNNPAALDVVIFGVFKWLFVLSALLYIFFAGIVVRQIGLMKETLETPFSSVVSIVGYVHLACAVLVFFIYLLAL